MKHARFVASRLLGLAAASALVTAACSTAPPESTMGGDDGEGGQMAGQGGKTGQGGKGGATGNGGAMGKGGAGPGTGGTPAANGGSPGGGGAGGMVGAGDAGGGSMAPDAGGGTDATASPPDSGAATSEKFSFFVTSQAAMRALSKNDKGFGGDLRFGKADGLSGADEICRQTAERSMPGNGKTWRAFLSVAKGPDGQPVHAIDRVGEGPWYDRRGRILAMTKADLLQPRPRGADPAIIDDLPNETGANNRYPNGPGTQLHDNHATLTGSGTDGKLWRTGAVATCQDWTNATAGGGKPHVGYTFPRGTVRNWMSIFDEPGCLPGGTIEQRGGANPNDPSVGSSGGYGAIYCFALQP